MLHPNYTSKTMFMEFGAFCFDNVKVIVHGFEKIESTFVLPENQ